jgi:hypothetical protein
MAVLSSNTVSVFPVDITTSLTPAQLVAAINDHRYDPDTSTTSQTGWGSIDDSEFQLGDFPGSMFQVGDVKIGHPWLRESSALAARYYWWQRDPRAIRVHGEAASPDTINRLMAGDVVFFPEKGRFVALVTARERVQRAAIVKGLRSLFASVDDHATVSEELGGFDLSEDLFLWLLYRLQSQQEISDNLYLVDITEINSMDRSMRGARFQDEASVERIDLAALVAVGTKSFGPAKLVISTVNPSAKFSFELFHDGGFQPFRRSEYEDRDFDGAVQALALIEDIWNVLLPGLRRAHRNDVKWEDIGRAQLRRDAKNNVLRLLGVPEQ